MWIQIYEDARTKIHKYSISIWIQIRKSSKNKYSTSTWIQIHKYTRAENTNTVSQDSASQAYVKQLAAELAVTRLNCKLSNINKTGVIIVSSISMGIVHWTILPSSKQPAAI